MASITELGCRAAPGQTVPVDLARDIRDIVDDQPGQIAVYARNLETGAVVDVDADRVLPTESAAKTFMLITYCRLVAAGACDPERTVTVPENFRINGTGVLRYLRPGTTLCLEDLAWLMVIVSDNVATALLLLEIGGPDPVNETMATLGLDSARLSSFDDMAAGKGFGFSNPRDLAEAYTHLDYRGRQKMFRQQDLIGLPRGLRYHANATDFGMPLPLRVYNKTGTGIGTFVDAGLFETDAARWVCAAMVADQDGFTSCPDDDAPVVVGRIGQRIHDAWVER
jgi:beta-lactamase class A